MNAEEINKKIEITWAAVQLYEDNGRISIPDLVNATGMSASEIYTLFPDKNAILAYYYPALIFQYWGMIDEIEGFEGYQISEKLSNFIYTQFDMMDEHTGFVKKTFGDLAFSKGWDSDYHSEITSLFKEFLTTDGSIAVSAGFFMKDFFYKTLASQYLFLVKYWIGDTSENKERTLALTDKLTGLFEEVVYNKTIDKSFDLAKYLWGSTNFDEWVPDFGWCKTSDDDEIEIEITDNEEQEETQEKTNKDTDNDE